MLDALAEDCAAGGKRAHVVLCGDMNAKEESPTHTLLTSKGNDSVLAAIQIDDRTRGMLSLLRECCDLAGALQRLSLSSAYETVRGEEPLTFVRGAAVDAASGELCDGDEAVAATLDYILASSSLEPLLCLDVPEGTDERSVMPSSVYPSDHVSLVAGFRLL
eukprot:TRINITY_DN18650_c0_g1_i1.p1 TRINITY_DN18650_c0_g1~~TRINITY_DN18650_c0_g1_i1.p1  ORF type:complete len:162 (+),score=37.34 TRINITY_DN18650_c0_g1_i1:1-486(+)